MDNQKSSNRKCRIIVDAMGGDHAPLNAVLGAVEAQHANRDIEVILIGKTEEIERIIRDRQLTFDSKQIRDADEVITMNDSPVEAIRSKQTSSMVIGLKEVKEGRGDAFVSAGNTGAVMTGSLFILGRIKGVGRPTIGTLMPNQGTITTIFDVGASVDSKPKHLLEYGIMGTIFVREIYKIPQPTVGLLSVGEEPSKGNQVGLDAYKLLEASGLNFVGNVEGRDILKGRVHIVVCDGFVGNIVLKFGESVPGLLKHLLREYAGKSLWNKIRVGLMKGTLVKVLKSLDYQEYGGVPLLGVNGISIIGHGSSSAKAFKNMIIRAKEMHDAQLIQKMEAAIEQYSSKSE